MGSRMWTEQATGSSGLACPHHPSLEGSKGSYNKSHSLPVSCMTLFSLHSSPKRQVLKNCLLYTGGS